MLVYKCKQKGIKTMTKMTYKQEQFIESLISKKQEECPELIYEYYQNKQFITMQQASNMIQSLLEWKDKTEEQLEDKKISEQVYYIVSHKKTKKWAEKYNAIRSALHINLTKQTSLTHEQCQAIKDIVF